MHRRLPILLALGLPLALGSATAACRGVGDGAGGAMPAADADPRAREVAERTIEAMGGWEGWERAGVLRWTFLAGRRHWWDVRTNEARIESDGLVVLLDAAAGEGRVFRGGAEVTEPAERAELLRQGHAWWVNDSYWLVMPWKLLDPGVRLRHAGGAELAGGRPADLLELTFAPGTGLTPENRYEVVVARDTGLVEEWRFFADAADPEPRFALPWTGWRAFGPILLATDRGRGHDWEIAVLGDAPRWIFTDPAPPALDG